MSIRQYVEQIAVDDPITRRETVLSILHDLGCSFTLQREEINGHYPQNIILSFGQGTPRLVIGAHYDSVSGSTGTNDNASGVAILLDLVRSFCAKSPLAPFDIVFFDLEEQEWLGSQSYLKHISPDKIYAYINLDICGVGDTIVIAPKTNLTNNILQKITPVKPQDSPVSIQVMEWLPPGDETSFTKVGIPSITVGVVPSKDVELMPSYLRAIREHKPSKSLPSITETIHNGPRDSIEVIQDTALQAVHQWLHQLVNKYTLYINDYQ
jgi:Zn-dependent M28 family amino/carboxypeptidase